MLEPGDILDHYRLEAAAARSGMGVLYRATDLNTGRTVAVKVPHPEMEADPVLLERFRREQEIGQILDHPGIVKTFNSEERSRLYMVLEWVDGRLLRALLNEERPFPHRARRGHRHRALRRSRRHAQARHRPPRPEARERDGGRRRPGQDHRLRHRHEGRRAPHHPCGGHADAGHAGLHSPEQVAGQTRRPAQRHLRAGHHALRDAHRPRALSPGPIRWR